MRWAGVVLPLLLAGCGSSDAGNREGRYQAASNSQGAGVYVLDTKTGELRLCMTGPVDGPGTIGISCMSPSKPLSLAHKGKPPEH